MENWKSKVILFYVVCAIIIGYPFFTIKYFESHTALKLAAKYFLIPIFLILVLVGPKFYMKKVKPLDKKPNSKGKEKFQDYFSISFMIICATGLFFFIAFSLIITTNKLFGSSEIVKLKEPVLSYHTNVTKHGRLQHYIEFANPKSEEIISLEVYREYKVGDIFEKEMKYGSWDILYSTE